MPEGAALITTGRIVTMRKMISLLKQRLSTYKPSSVKAGTNTRASVLIPLMGEDGDERILLTRRTNSVRSHKGEISFPGGMYEESDGETVRTAVRECGEEIGVRPGDIEIVGRLSDMETMTGFVITPYVGLIPFPYDFKLNPHEVRYLIYLPFPFLMSCRPEAATAERNGQAVEVFEIVYNGERIWGATCRLLIELRRILDEEV